MALEHENARESEVSTLNICNSTLLFFIRNIQLPGEESDSALIIRNPKLSKTVIVPQKSYHGFAAFPEEIMRSAITWAQHLLPNASLTKKEFIVLADTVLNKYGDLLKHLPDDQLSFDDLAERYGLKMAIGGETVLDAT